MADASETSSTAVAGCRNASKAAKAANGRDAKGWRGELKKTRRRAHVKALGRKRDDAALPTVRLNL